MDVRPRFTLRHLGPGDAGLLRSMLVLFSAAFEDPETYTGAVPEAPYHESLLASATFLALVALEGESVVGGIAGYELSKFERKRKEIYLYDLAVAASHRRLGIATSLIRELQALAARRGASGVFVQADRSDLPAIAFYSRLGVRQEVLHFDLPPLPLPAPGGGRRR